MAVIDIGVEHDGSLVSAIAVERRRLRARGAGTRVDRRGGHLLVEMGLAGVGLGLAVLEEGLGDRLLMQHGGFHCECVCFCFFGCLEAHLVLAEQVQRVALVVVAVVAGPLGGWQRAGR